ncbi:haloacid dehalogenase type II [Roseomonas eburnea]|uniref:(S)-2-haloacid dehalogenase n=1 Tax=Neoroseomonas eburnea TaxID=1346889 RepID=A0A9X9XJZ4_9PROT|nr:haloacid dehalogenase type II [Neoroseomonas eburnea]MBR0684030.1 haloacid dehalogenase type II [Neoroseomonas eburnea]
MPAPEAVVFDAYGTLLDVNAAMAAHAARLGDRWAALSAEWRAKQLEYTWVRSLTGAAHHEDFWLCTRDALEFVFARHKISDPRLAKDLMEAYRTLPAYPEVPAMLATVRAQGIATAILSNGTPGMLADAVAAAGIAPLIDEILSVEEVGVFKPDPRVYRLATRQFGCPPDRLVFVSGNAWDVQAAHAFNMSVVRVDRSGGPDEYGLAAAEVTVLPDLSGLPDLLA